MTFRFYTDQNTLVRGLHVVQKERCDYQSTLDRPSAHCDCKYGIATYLDEIRERNPEKYKAYVGRIHIYLGEQNGCCEVMQARDMLSALTSNEFKRIIDRLHSGLVEVTDDGVVMHRRKRVKPNGVRGR